MGIFVHKSETVLQRNRGFTLIELSIVLVIIGLIVGGVLVGRDLIKAAEIRATITQKEQIIAAVNTFEAKYNCLPGDCANATSFWGTGGGCPSNGGISPLTCNGNGNEKIAADFNDPVDFQELYRFWQHLGNARLIPGMYSGYTTVPGGGSTASIGVDIPQFPIGTVGLMVGHTDVWGDPAITGGGATGITLSGRGNILYTGGGAANLYPHSDFSLLTIQQIDTKLDDGKPITGKVTTGIYSNWYGDLNGNPCWTTVSGVAAYTISSTRQDCPLMFVGDF